MMLRTAGAGLTTPAVAGRGLSEGLARTCIAARTPRCRGSWLLELGWVIEELLLNHEFVLPALMREFFEAHGSSIFVFYLEDPSYDYEVSGNEDWPDA